MLVFTGMCVCVRAKLTLVSFFLVFSLFFFCTFPLGHLTRLETLISFSGFPAPLSTVPCRVVYFVRRLPFKLLQHMRMETKRCQVPGARRVQLPPPSNPPLVTLQNSVTSLHFSPTKVQPSTCRSMLITCKT